MISIETLMILMDTAMIPIDSAVDLIATVMVLVETHIVTIEVMVTIETVISQREMKHKRNLMTTMAVSMAAATAPYGTIAVSMAPFQSLWGPRSPYGNCDSLYGTLTTVCMGALTAEDMLQLIRDCHDYHRLKIKLYTEIPKFSAAITSREWSR
jgi:hypothetical protein